ncbi:glycoside hydrolase [Gyrodon lividus]|nr:glycoside hydrolase [Gyrodon lividus]
MVVPPLSVLVAAAAVVTATTTALPATTQPTTSPAPYTASGPPPTCTAVTTIASVTVSAPTATPTKTVGKLPALGWNTWNAYGCNITDALVLAAANDMRNTGLAEAGYQYVNIDDCWAELMRDNSTGRIVADHIKFPNGISGVATELHSLGLKLGIYSDAGDTTCAGYPGSLGHEKIDAATFTEWGVDYNCHIPGNWTDSCSPPGGDWYAALGTQKTPIEYNLCVWGRANVWEWGSKVGHSWRVTGDITPTWSSVISIITANAAILDHVDFYSHNDMDMMEIGNGNLTIQEERSHFAVWAFMKSPILLGTTLSELSADQLAIISNFALLAFHQDDAYGAPAKPFNASFSSPPTSPPEYYAGKSAKGTHVFILNAANSTQTKTFDFSNVPGIAKSKSPYTVEDMWTSKVIAITDERSFSVSVDAHDTKAYLII